MPDNVWIIHVAVLPHCCNNPSLHLLQLCSAAADVIIVPLRTRLAFAGDALRGYLPAACPSVAAVTAVDETGSAAASFSNFLEVNGATPEDQARIIAAPGTKIRSTISFAKVGCWSLTNSTESRLLDQYTLLVY